MEHILPKKETKRDRQKAFIAAYCGDQHFNIAATCRAVGIGRTTFYRWQEDKRFVQEFEDAREELFDLIEVALLKRIENGDTTAIIFACKTLCRHRGYIEGEKVRVGASPDKRTIEIIDSLLAGTTDVITAGFQFAKEGIPLPEAVRLLIVKAQPEPPPPDMPPAMSDSDLEKRDQEALEKQKVEREVWVPTRQAEVAELKKELKGIDSFAPDAKE
jgi:hypothetical protein